MVEFALNVWNGIVENLDTITAGMSATNIVTLVIYIMVQRKKNKKLDDNTAAATKLNETLTGKVDENLSNQELILEKLDVLTTASTDQNYELDTILEVMNTAYQNIKNDDTRNQISNLITEYRTVIATHAAERKTQAQNALEKLQKIMEYKRLNVEDNIDKVKTAFKENAGAAVGKIVSDAVDNVVKRI